MVYFVGVVDSVVYELVLMGLFVFMVNCFFCVCCVVVEYLYIVFFVVVESSRGIENVVEILSLNLWDVLLSVMKEICKIIYSLLGLDFLVFMLKVLGKFWD